MVKMFMRYTMLTCNLYYNIKQPYNQAHVLQCDRKSLCAFFVVLITYKISRDKLELSRIISV